MLQVWHLPDLSAHLSLLLVMVWFLYVIQTSPRCYFLSYVLPLEVQAQATYLAGYT